jgi:hypothetical protein
MVFSGMLSMDPFHSRVKAAEAAFAGLQPSPARTIFRQASARSLGALKSVGNVKELESRHRE